VKVPHPESKSKTQTKPYESANESKPSETKEKTRANEAKQKQKQTPGWVDEITAP
jgi:hypothetical protein